jgi:diguanylate cyclase (GGDEF)-like protein
MSAPAVHILRLERELASAQLMLEDFRTQTIELLKSIRKATYDASHDDLTGLPNRHAFRSRLTEIIEGPYAPNAALALLYMDLDEFKRVNDMHGHAVGDQLLRIVGTRLAYAVREGDMVSRIGGDEFACLLTNLENLSTVGRMAVKLREAIAAPMALNGCVFHCRLSVGIAIAPPSGVGVDDLMRRADHAMFQAKRTRSGHKFFALTEHVIPALRAG